MARRSKIPGELRFLTPFIRRAEQLEQQSQKRKASKARQAEMRIVAYYCRRHVIWQASPRLARQRRDCRRRGSGDVQGQEASRALVEALKERNRREPITLLVQSEQGAKTICRSFANRVFAAADDGCIAGDHSRATARAFYHAYTYFALLGQFPADDDDEADRLDHMKRAYAKLMAVLMARTLRTPGGTLGPQAGFAATMNVMERNDQLGNLLDNANTFDEADQEAFENDDDDDDDHDDEHDDENNTNRDGEMPSRSNSKSPTRPRRSPPPRVASPSQQLPEARQNSNDGRGTNTMTTTARRDGNNSILLSLVGNNNKKKKEAAPPRKQRESTSPTPSQQLPPADPTELTKLALQALQKAETNAAIQHIQDALRALGQ